MKTMMSTVAAMVVVAAILGTGMVTPAEGSGRALLGLGALIDKLIDCPPPPTEDSAPGPYGAPYGTSPDGAFSPEAGVYEPATPEYEPATPEYEPAAPEYEPSAPEYESPPAYASPIDESPAPVYEPSPVDESPAPVYEPSPEYQTPPAGGY